IQQYTDQRALDPAVVRLRHKVKAAADETLRKDQAFARVRVGGRTLEASVQHASGTIDNPMTDAAIENKFIANAEPTIGTDAARRVRDMVWKLEAVADVRELVAALA
ncbi:MAG: MmgE/PrpD family protein, partial [Betaproteobacteria bacterium]|nr:MmgE/PrpD family protein [Betaproteobacteria bacterium]